MGTSPEEVETWRAERRAKFPSADKSSTTAPVAVDPETVPPSAPKALKMCKYFRQGRCKRGDQCTFKHDTEAPTAEKERPNSSKSVDLLKSNLLRKLLERDIDQEDTLLLQCIHFLRGELS